MPATLCPVLPPAAETADYGGAGLGNRSITPDALGVLVAERMFVTRHLQHALSETDFEVFANLRPVSALTTGVMGQTGMESAELLRQSVKRQNRRVWW